MHKSASPTHQLAEQLYNESMAESKTEIVPGQNDFTALFSYNPAQYQIWLERAELQLSKS